LAARLGSPYTQNRRGNVLLQTDFSDGLGVWRQTKSGTNSAIYLTNDYFRTAGVAVRLYPDTALSNYAGLRAMFGPLTETKLGIQLSFMPSSSWHELNFLIYYVVSGVAYTYDVRLDGPAKTIKLVLTESGTVVLESNFAIETANLCWHTVRLVVDVESISYDTLTVDMTEYDISAYKPLGAATDSKPFWYLELQATGNGSAQHSVYVDDIVLTIND